MEGGREEGSETGRERSEREGIHIMFTINIGGVLVMHKKGKRSNKCEMSKMSIHSHTLHTA